MILENIKAEVRKIVHIINPEGICSHHKRGKEENLKVDMYRSHKRRKRTNDIYKEDTFILIAIFFTSKVSKYLNAL